jgi:hypothetical protein
MLRLKYGLLQMLDPSSPPPGWQMGFNFQLFIQLVLGDHMERPLQKFHGSQIETLFTRQDEIWQAEPLKSAIEALQSDDTVGVYIRDLLKGWQAVSKIHSLVNTHPAKSEEMKVAVQEYKSALSTFEFELPGAKPKPCFVKRRFYDHATLDHLVKQAERLHLMGLSQALVSSRWLEGNNRPAKVHAKLLTGGGRVVDGAFGNDTLLLISRHLTQQNFIKRRMLNRDTLAGTQAREEAKRVHSGEVVDSDEQAGPSSKRPKRQALCCS